MTITHNDITASKTYFDSSKGLLVRNIFGPTIQGEMPYAGTPAVFLRLGGCHRGNKSAPNGCSFCDTDFRVSHSSYMTADEIGSAIRRAWGSSYSPKGRLLVVSGGEPFLQSSLMYVCYELILKLGVKIQFETTGDIYLDLQYPLHTVVLSPKRGNSKQYSTNLAGWFSPDSRFPNVFMRHLIEEDGPYRTLHPLIYGMRPEKVFLSPIAVWKKALPEGVLPSLFLPDISDYLDMAKTRANYMAAVYRAVHYGWRVSGQMQLLFGVE